MQRDHSHQFSITLSDCQMVLLSSHTPCSYLRLLSIVHGKITISLKGPGGFSTGKPGSSCLNFQNKSFCRFICSYDIYYDAIFSILTSDGEKHGNYVSVSRIIMDRRSIIFIPLSQTLDTDDFPRNIQKSSRLPARKKQFPSNFYSIRLIFY